MTERMFWIAILRALLMVAAAIRARWCITEEPESDGPHE